MPQKSPLMNITVTRDLIPEFLAALDMAVSELRKQYRDPTIPAEFAENVGRLNGLRQMIGAQFAADEAA